MINRAAGSAPRVRCGGVVPPIGGDTTPPHLPDTCGTVPPRKNEPSRNRPAEPSRTPSDRLRALAAEVARLGNDARGGAEGFVVGKLTIASELRRLARELDR